MKIICEQSKLITSINIVLKAVPSKTTMEILDCIKITVEKDSIYLVGNDMALGIETVVDGIVNEEGSLVVNAKTFSDIIRNLPDDEIFISADDKVMIIKCGRINYDIPVRNAMDYPDIPKIEKDNFAVLSQLTLKNMIRQTVFSIGSENDAMKVISGELLEIKGNRMRIVSLDGNRISLRNVELNDDYGNQKVIVPGKALNELVKILSSENDDKVTIYFGKNHIMFKMDNTIVVSRLIEGEYYLVDRMLSGDYETKVKVNKKNLSDCIERAALLIKENDKKPLIFNYCGDVLNVNVKTQSGRYEDSIEIEKEGNDIVIAFNTRFMLEAIKSIDDEVIDIYLMNIKSPCVIKDPEESYIYMILPVNFNPNL